MILNNYPFLRITRSCAIEVAPVLPPTTGQHSLLSPRLRQYPSSLCFYFAYSFSTFPASRSLSGVDPFEAVHPTCQPFRLVLTFLAQLVPLCASPVTPYDHLRHLQVPRAYVYMHLGSQQEAPLWCAAFKYAALFPAFTRSYTLHLPNVPSPMHAPVLQRTSVCAFTRYLLLFVCDRCYPHSVSVHPKP